MLVVFAVLLAAATAATALLVPAAFAQATSGVGGWLFIVLAIVGAVLVRLGGNGKDRMAFYGSSLAGASMVGISGRCRSSRSAGLLGDPVRR